MARCPKHARPYRRRVRGRRQVSKSRSHQNQQPKSPWDQSIAYLTLKRQKFGPSSEKIEREIDQLQLALEDLEVAMATAGAKPEPTEAAATTEAPAERAVPRRRGLVELRQHGAVEGVPRRHPGDDRRQLGRRTCARCGCAICFSIELDCRRAPEPTTRATR